MQVKIEKLVYGGEGLAHHQGHTVFVPFVLPDEVVTIQPTERKKKFIRGRVAQIVSRSPARTAPPCPHFTVCGGCHYQHIPYETQLSLKTEILRETLWRIGRVEWEEAIVAHASPPFGYRNRAQWKVRPRDKGLAIGYFQAGSSALCAVDECRVLSPRIEEVLAALRSLLARGEIPATLREIEAFTDGDGAKVLLSASFSSFDTPPERVAEDLRNAFPCVETVLLHESTRDRFELFGPGFIQYTVSGTTYQVGHLSFFQVNRFLVEEMVHTIVGESQGGLALDLYAGVGLFTIPLAKRFERVVAVESNAAATRDLLANIRSSSASAEAQNTEVEKFLAGMKEKPELVVLDPPRAGLGADIVKRLLELAPARINYISCDPSTLARDLNGLTGSGAYAITEVHLFDVFPQTFHIESLVRLTKCQ